MKKIVQVQEVDGEGLEGLLDKNVVLFCLNYIYTGKLTGVNTSCVRLDNAALVYETGAFSDKKFKDAQRLSFPLYVQAATIESFSETDKT